MYFRKSELVCPSGSFVDYAGIFSPVIPRCAIAHLRMRHLAQARKSILMIVVMDSGLALRAPRNDEERVRDELSRPYVTQRPG